MRGNYNSQFTSGNNSDRCSVRYRGASAEQAIEVKAVADLIRNSVTTFGNKTSFVLFIESLANTTLTEEHLLMKPYSYDSNKEVSNFNKYYALVTDSINQYVQPLTFGIYKNFFGTVSYGEPMDWLADTLGIESYTYFLNNMNGYFVPLYQTPSLSSVSTSSLGTNFNANNLVTLDLTNMGYFYSNTLDIMRRQGSYITI